MHFLKKKNISFNPSLSSLPLVCLVTLSKKTDSLCSVNEKSFFINNEKKIHPPLCVQIDVSFWEIERIWPDIDTSRVQRANEIIEP